METQKKEIIELIDSLGNIPKTISDTPYMEWMEHNNPQLEVQPSVKKGCKTGKCGNNKRTFTIIGILLFVMMLAGHGLFTLIENLLK